MISTTGTQWAPLQFACFTQIFVQRMLPRRYAKVSDILCTVIPFLSFIFTSFFSFNIIYFAAYYIYADTLRTI